MLTIREVIKTFYNALLQRLKKHRGNWEQNDPTADDYIKNRPFYTDETNKETVVKTKTFTATSSYWWGSPFAFIPVVGETYKVTFDGKEYICPGYLSQGAPSIGNVAIDGSGPDTGEPFFYYWYDSYEYGLCVRYQGKHTITVEKIKIVKIDERYLPENNNAEIEMAIDDLYDYAGYLENNLFNIPTDTVRYNSQSLTNAQKQTARTNIGAASMTEVNTKVDKVNGKGLSTNDYTTEDKEKLNGLAIYAPGYFSKAVTPKSVTRGYGETATFIVFDFGTHFRPSDTFTQYANNGKLTINYGYKTISLNFGTYKTNINGIEGFGFYNTVGSAAIMFKENGQLWVSFDDVQTNAENAIIQAFATGKSVTVSLPDCVDVMIIDPKLEIASQGYTDTIVMCSVMGAGAVRVPLHTYMGATALDGDGYYSNIQVSNCYVVSTFPDMIVVDGIEYRAIKVSGTKSAYGNLSLVPDNIYDGTDNEDADADFALVMHYYHDASNQRYETKYYLFSKEEGYQLPEVYSRVYHLSTFPRSDWNQSDSEQTDYIKNRTHYEELIVGETLYEGYGLIGIENQTILHPLYNALDEGHIAELVVGENTYRGIVKNTTIQPDLMYHIKYIGNLSLEFPEDGENTGEDYLYAVYYYISSGYTNFSNRIHINNQLVSDNTIKTIIRYPDETKVYQLDEKFIPSTIARTEDIPTVAQPDWKETDETSLAFIKNKPDLDALKDYIALRDQVNGFTYYVSMRNGNLVSTCAVSSLEIAAMPITVEYMEGEDFNIDGLAINAVREDGTVFEITEYTYDVPSPLTPDVVAVTINYVDMDKTHTIDVPITVNIFDPAVILADFNYTDNGNGTYTITGWKGTENGEPSTRIVVPDYQQIIL